MPLSDDDIREILRLIDESDVEELRIETEAFSLYLRRGASEVSAADGEPQGALEAKASSSTPAAVVSVDAEPPGLAAGDLVTIFAPMLGTFYRAEAPGAAPFVDVGARVELDTVVCLIEVMKMMNSIHAGVAGTIAEICAENAELVEYGAPLFQVQPDR